MMDVTTAHLEIMSRRDIRKNIFNLENELSKLDGAIFNFDDLVTSRFCDGIYAREIHLPKGMLIVAKIHNTQHFSVISQGEVLVLTEWGSERIKAPYTFISQRFTKRVVYVLEDTIWTTFHRTDKKDLKEIEEEVIAKNYEELEKLENEVLMLGTT